MSMSHMFEKTEGQSRNTGHIGHKTQNGDKQQKIQHRKNKKVSNTDTTNNIGRGQSISCDNFLSNPIAVLFAIK